MRIKSLRNNLKALVIACFVWMLFTACVISPIRAASDTVQPLRIYRYAENVTINANASNDGSNGYSGSASASWVLPNCNLDVYISTDQNLWTFTWSGAYFIVVPLPAPYMGLGTSWHV